LVDVLLFLWSEKEMVNGGAVYAKRFANDLVLLLDASNLRE
jgi:hypothetical protein